MSGIRINVQQYIVNAQAVYVFEKYQITMCWPILVIIVIYRLLLVYLS